MSITPFFHVYHKYVFIMANINKIKLSGTTYEIQDLNATKTVELTQAEYDELSPKDPNTFYIITDANAGDLSNYYTKTETDGLLDTKLDVTAYTPTDLSNYYTKGQTSGATEISTALASKADTATTYTKTETDNAITAATSTKQDTLVSGTNIKTINGETLLGEGNITIEGGSGGGKSIEAGTNISITTGETADTINCTLNAKNGTGESSFIANGTYGGIMNSATGVCATAFGLSNEANSRASFVIGGSNYGNGEYSFVGGNSSEAIGGNSFAFGYGAKAIGTYSIAFGSYFPLANNTAEVAIGKSNVSNTGSTDADKTLFSVGNGTNSSNRHNAFEIRQNGDIYISKDGQDIKLQDQLGGGGGSSYTAGDGIDITNDVISVTGKVDTSAITTTITSSSTDAQVPSAKAVYDIVGNIETLLSKI
mgnify:CR=1 FL=1